MGLTGVITSATIEMTPIETSRLRVDTERIGDIDELMARMEAADDEYRYSVAWVDLLAQGRDVGRAVLTCGDFASRGELAGSAARDPLRFSPHTLLAAPPWVPSGLLRRGSVRVLNEAWFRKAPRHEVGAMQSIGAFFHPLDGIRDWNRVYGREGFLQWQIVVPFGEERAFRRIVERLSEEQCPSFVTVLKRFGEGHGWLSFPIPGWTLAVDIPTGIPGLRRLLDELDLQVLDAGGRVYLAKDSRLQPRMLAQMYPELARWREVRERLDPNRTLQSDLARRLSL
jgi:decaprenylphospho-beta-D-ribofuranose 2-oxidase